MTDKEYNKMIADVRRSVSRKYGFRQSSYVNFKVESGYFFCLYFLTGDVRLTVKPMYADDLWWNIWDASDNKNEPLSLRGTGAYSLSGQILTSDEITKVADNGELTNIIDGMFKNATDAISKFIIANPNADTFFPDESKMDYDPDRLLYLIALIHNGKEEDALAIIKEARKNKHRCIFQSGMFSDSYTYIRRWCNREQATIRIRNVFASIFNNIVQIRAYALMALGRNNKKDTLPSVYTVIFLLCGLLSGFVAFKWFRKSNIKLSLSVWIANSLSVAICFLLPNLNKSTTHLDYLILFLIMYSLISIIPYIVITTVYSLISKRL